MDQLCVPKLSDAVVWVATVLNAALDIPAVNHEEDDGVGQLGGVVVAVHTVAQMEVEALKLAAATAGDKPRHSPLNSLVQVSRHFRRWERVWQHTPRACNQYKMVLIASHCVFYRMLTVA